MYIEVGIQPAEQPNRIALHVPSRLRIVVAIVVVEKPGLSVEVLAGQYSDRPLPQREVFMGGSGEWRTRRDEGLLPSVGYSERVEEVAQQLLFNAVAWVAPETKIDQAL